MTAPRDDLPALEDTPFKIEAAEDLLSLPDPDWLVNGIIQRNTLALIYGPSGCGKSFLALDLAHHLALQRAWFSHEVDKRAGVLYVAAEASGGIVKRVKAFRQHHQLAESTYCPLWFIRSPVDLLAPKTVDDIESTSAAWANLDLSEDVSNGAADLGTGAAAGEPSKKSIGRPKGYPKSGGRTKDSPAPSETKNDTPPPGLPPRELRRWLAEKSD